MKKLSAQIEVAVRFSEVDSMGIVWHGHYAQYFEEAREEFGRKYGLGYMLIFSSGYYAPLVTLNFDYKRPLVYGDKIRVEIEYVASDASKLIFDYKILSTVDESIITTGRSVQVFLDKGYELQWVNPPFYELWKGANL